MIFEEGLDFDDVLIVPRPQEVLNLHSRQDVDLDIVFGEWSGVPIIASNVNSIGTFKTAKVLSKYGMLTCIHKSATEKEFQEADLDLRYVIPSSGISPTEIKKLADIVDVFDVQFACIDVANGYLDDVLKAIEIFRLKSKHRSEVNLIVGNVVTEAGAARIMDAGADIVKVGIGNGSVCTTRLVTGIGYPQFSAVNNCYNVGPVLSDGGVKNSGDIVKAFVGGATFVMSGALFVGSVETGHEYFGMSSRRVMGLGDYKASEGKNVQVPVTHTLDDVCKGILGGLRSACTYLGVASLKEVLTNRESIDVVKVNRQYNTYFGESKWIS